MAKKLLLNLKFLLAFFVAGVNCSSSLTNGLLPITLPPIPQPTCSGVADLIPPTVIGDCLGLPFLIIECQQILPLNTTVAAINKTTVSISGFSAGGSEASQFHFSHSSLIKRVGIFAGSPYLLGADTNLPPGSIGGGLNFIRLAIISSQVNVTKLEQMAVAASNAGKIDPISNINGSKVYIFSGQLDLFAPPSLARKIAEMYRYFGAVVEEVYPANANHVMPTQCFGGPCEIFNPVHDAVNRCNYSGVFEMFEHLYGLEEFIRPKDEVTPIVTGLYYAFDQRPFCPAEFTSQNCYMQENGYIYVPKYCQDPSNTCHVHVALHGSFQSGYSALTSNVYALYTGYAPAADLNNIIIIFPQAAIVFANSNTTNFGTWDFFGATGSEFPYKGGPQTQAVMNILSAIAKF